MAETPNALTYSAASPQEAAGHFAARLAFEADPDDIARDMKAGNTDGYVLVETRSRAAFDAARIPGAIHLPYGEMTPESTAHLDRDITYVCYCASFQCNAAAKGALQMSELGFRVKVLAGGIGTWIADGNSVERADPTAA